MKQQTHHFSMQYLVKIYIAFILLIVCLSSFSYVEAAVIDRKDPSAPTKLQVKEKTDITVTLTWNRSSDNVGIKGYDIYQNNIFIANTSATKYTVKNLSPKTSYTFLIKSRDTSGNVSTSSTALKVTTSTKIIDQPPQVSHIQVSPIANDGQTISGTVTLSVNPSDDKGISKVEFYSDNGSKLIKSLTSAPYSVNWATFSSVQNGQQILKVIVYDTANQKSETSKTVIIKNPEEGKYKKVGYYSGWSTYSNYHVSQIDPSKLTHINYAFANISSDGKIALGDSWADVEKPFPGDTAGQPFKGNFYQLKKLKEQNPHLKTLISVGGWTWSEKFSDVALTEQSRTIFAQSCLQFILQYGFDGVDLDWEYPVGGGEADNITRPEDKRNFTLLLMKIRETFDAQSARDGKQYVLTIAGGAGTSFVKNTELHLIQQYVDYVQLMSYDIHGPWDTLTGMNAPLYRDQNSGFNGDWSVEDAVQMYLNNGVPANKLVMGVPFYGRAYSGVPNLNNGLYQSFSRGETALGYSVLESNYINKNGYTRYWQPYSKVPWLFNGSQFISYDDVESMGYKTNFIKEKGLGGAMIWELSQDPNRVLLTKIDNDLK